MLTPQYFLILNITPDSFSDGTDHIADGDYQDSKWLFNKAEMLIKSGANVLDIGAESTRPGAETVSIDEEINRLENFLKVFCEKSNFPLSIDTRKAEVMKAILSEPLFYKNIAFINDVEGFGDEEKLKVIKEIDVESKLKLIAMHSSVGVPPKIKTHMIPDNFYLEKKHLRAGTFFNYGKTPDENLSKEEMEAYFENLCQFFESLQEKAKSYGIKEENLIFDPGLGFGKNLKHSYALLQLIPKFIQKLRSDVFIGASRKSFIREIIEQESISKTLNHSDYLNALDMLTEKYNSLCYQVGANLFRVHVHPSEIKAYNIHRLDLCKI
ncbi:MAG: dihydropteroate synthase [Candidatus Caenarcaniphilales bacterium]|nr:dihydropteroate synthase [Candidatus Caenarcaniphilales bacterium]